MSKLIDLIEKTFSKLIVLERASNSQCGATRWKCRCACGNIVIVEGLNLRSVGGLYELIFRR
jgi:hypothetical protein